MPTQTMATGGKAWASAPDEDAIAGSLVSWGDWPSGETPASTEVDARKQERLVAGE